MGTLTRAAAVVILLVLSAAVELQAQFTTQRSATVAIVNETGRAIAAVHVVHKYSDVFKDKHSWNNVAAGATTPASMTVRYNTGALTTGRDWWAVSWSYAGESVVHYTNPNNFRAFLDGMEMAGQIVVPIGVTAIAAAIAAPSGPGVAAATAGGAVAGLMISDALMNSESTDGFKQHILRADDAGKRTLIRLRGDGSVVFESVSGQSQTVSATRQVAGQVSADAQQLLNAQSPRDAAPAGGPVRIQNRYRASYLHTESSALEAGSIQPGWLSAQWTLEPVAGDAQYVRIRNLYRTDQHIHIENGRAESGAIQPGWLSAQWVVSRVEGTEFSRICNRWKPEECLHTERGPIEAGRIEPGWLSAQWTIK